MLDYLKGRIHMTVTLSDTKNKMNSIRSTLIKTLTANKMFWTAALMAEVDNWSVREVKPDEAVAFVRISKEITVGVRKDIIESSVIYDDKSYDPSKIHNIKVGRHEVKVSGYMAFTVILHELRHIPQVYSRGNIARDLLLPELYGIYEMMDRFNELKNKDRKKVNALFRLCNIVMDMQLHNDILKMPEIKIGFDQLSNYLVADNILSNENLIAKNNKMIEDIQSGKAVLRGKLKDMPTNTVIDSLLQQNEKIQEIIVKLEEKMKNGNGGYLNNLCTVQQFDEMFPDPDNKHPIEAQKASWAELLNVAHLRLKEQKKEEGGSSEDDGESEEGEGNGDGEGEGEGSGDSEGSGKSGKAKDGKASALDDHEFDEGESQEEKRDRQRRLEKAIRGAAAGGDILQRNNGMGGDARDAAMFVKEKKIDTQLIRLITKIKTCINLLNKPTAYRLTWTVTRNRGGVCLPSERQISETKANSAIALVLDTSGSMWSDEILNASYSVSKALYRAGKLGGLYYGDTTIYKVELDKPIPSVFRGGGGTELQPEHVDLIRKDLQLKDHQVLDIVYVTDGMVDLKEILRDKRAKLHLVINREGELSLLRPEEVQRKWG
jgi:hypothetical protein